MKLRLAFHIAAFDFILIGNERYVYVALPQAESFPEGAVYVAFYNARVFIRTRHGLLYEYTIGH
jgi:hypothetical protein